jgi:hypothetical protein
VSPPRKHPHRLARFKDIDETPIWSDGTPFAKIGAVTTAFLFPMLLADIGTRSLLFILVGTSLAGALITHLFRIETTGINLEQIGGAGQEHPGVKA